MTTYHFLRVFTGPDCAGGNSLGVFLEPVPVELRQAVAAELGFSETVFVDDRATGELRIHTPTVELPLAGHPLVGAARLLGVDVLRPPAGAVPAWRDGELTWIRARAEWAQMYDIVHLPGPADVDAFTIPGGDAMIGAWAWEDKDAGRVRARVFPNGIGIAEDEATGAHAIQLGAQLGRAIVIRQGTGSELHARPDAASGTVAIGGRVELVEQRAFAPPDGLSRIRPPLEARVPSENSSVATPLRRSAGPWTVLP